MGIYRNQAQRVFDHIQKDTGLSIEVLDKNLKISVDKIEKSIESSCKGSGINGKNTADLLIKTWNASAPDYIETNYPYSHDYMDMTYRFRPLEKEVIIHMVTKNGDFLHNIPNTGGDPNDLSYRDGLCERAFEAYCVKCKTLGLTP